MSVPISTSFTAVGVSATLRLNRGDAATFALSGTYAATIQFEKASTPDESAWSIIAGPHSIANATVSDGYTAKKDDERVRARCFAFTSGTAVTVLTDTGSTAQAQAIPGNLTVAGVSIGGAPQKLGTAKTLLASDAGKTWLFDQLAGSLATLPAATGTGNAFKFVVGTVNTSLNHSIKTSPSSDVFTGGITTEDAAVVTGYVPGATDNTILLNATTKGGLSKGDWIEVTDLAAGVWGIQGQTSSSGVAATPFSTV